MEEENSSEKSGPCYPSYYGRARSTKILRFSLFDWLENYYDVEQAARSYITRTFTFLRKLIVDFSATLKNKIEKCQLRKRMIHTLVYTKTRATYFWQDKLHKKSQGVTRPLESV